MNNHEKQVESIRVLINGIAVAQKRGAFSLEEASFLHEAVAFLTTPPEERTPTNGVNASGVTGVVTENDDETLAEL
jgi:hypothetical protein